MGMIDGVKSQIVSVSNPEISSARVSASESKTAQAQTNEKVSLDEKDKKETLVNVVAKSKDGDTLQENQESIEALKDGLMMKKSPIEAADEISPAKKYLEQQKEINNEKVAANKEEESKNDEKVNSLIGMTRTQVEQLYREGRITKNQYDKNMESRDERIDKAIQNDESSEFVQMVEKSKKVQQNIEDIFEAAKHERVDIVSQLFN